MTTTLFARAGSTGSKNGDSAPNQRDQICAFELTKPKNTNNPKVNGYRKPSSYARTVKASFSGANVQRGPIPVPYHYSGQWTRRPGKDDEVSLSRYGTMCGGVNWPGSPPDINNIRMKLLNNLKNEYLDVGMVLAEIQGTAQTLGNNLGRVGRSLNALKKGKAESFYYLLNGRRRDNRRPTDKFLRETSGAFLEWKYGIMPTIYDIQGACKALDAYQEGSLFNNPPLLVARARDRISGRHTVPFRINGSTLGQDSSVEVRVTYERSARCDYRVSGDRLRGLNRFGLGLGTIATIAFDKTPFTFVLNMAIPIADLIKAWSALAGVDVVGYSETLYREAQVRRKKVELVHSANDYIGSIPCEIENGPKVIEMNRKAFDSVPMPMPFVRNPVKVSNMATVLALFTQLRKS